MTRVLTGIQASGSPHIGNYLGMMQPAINLQNQSGTECFYFIADQHSFTSNKNPEIFRENQKNTILDWLALGLDPEKSTFYRQSHVPAHTELMWYLLCFTPMGLLERAHSYKDKKSNGIEANAGLFTYPILMASDILLYDAEIIPVGKDQKQHVEMARDIAQKINHHFQSDIFVLPEARISQEVATIPGVDGRKMSKSYGNTIPIFADEKTMKKQIMSIKTESVEMGESIDPETCGIFAFHRLFKNPDLKNLEQQYRSGAIGFGESKKQLFHLIWETFASARKKRAALAKDPGLVSEILNSGEVKANGIAREKLQIFRKTLGL